MVADSYNMAVQYVSATLYGGSDQSNTVLHDIRTRFEIMGKNNYHSQNMVHGTGHDIL